MRDDIKEVTIEIFAKPIGNVARNMGPYHLYIVYTDENNKKWAFSAGPEGRDGAAYDFIKATKENLRTTFKTYGNIHPDWNKGNKHTKLLTIKSPLSERKSKIELA